MAERPNFLWSALVKGAMGVLVGVILMAIAWAAHFPFIFQAMFFFYAMLGAAVYILLDAPPVKPIGGFKAVAVLIAFYLVLSGVYIGGASLWPQYDPEIEKGKIETLLKRRRAATEQGKAEELLARTKALTEKADAIMARLKSAGIGEAPAAAVAVKPGAKAAAGDLVALGLEQWDLHECYNCHVITGKGMTAKKKKRGPNLDNIGNMMTAEQLKEKIFRPKSWMAEGYEKQYEKGKMPDKYIDLMFDDELEVLVAFLGTLKDPSADTPKAIKKK